MALFVPPSGSAASLSSVETMHEDPNLSHGRSLCSDPSLMSTSQDPKLLTMETRSINSDLSHGGSQRSLSSKMSLSEMSPREICIRRHGITTDLKAFTLLVEAKGELFDSLKPEETKSRSTTSRSLDEAIDKKKDLLSQLEHLPKCPIKAGPSSRTANSTLKRTITWSYYRNSVGALLLYDITRRSSFEHLVEWLFEARRHIEPGRAVFEVVACKVDLESSRVVSTEEGKAFADSYGLSFIETSAKTGFNLEKTFVNISQEIYDKIQCGELKVQDGWDGIKKGFSRSENTVHLLEAEAERDRCC